MRPNGAAIRVLVTKAVIVGATMVHSSQAEGFMVGTLSSIFISIRVILVGKFRHRYRYQIGVSLVIVVPVVRSAVSRRGAFS